MLTVLVLGLSRGTKIQFLDQLKLNPRVQSWNGIILEEDQDIFDWMDSQNDVELSKSPPLTVTVIDVKSFWQHFLGDSCELIEVVDEFVRSAAEILISQIERCDWLILANLQTMTTVEEFTKLTDLKMLLSCLNPQARITEMKDVATNDWDKLEISFINQQLMNQPSLVQSIQHQSKSAHETGIMMQTWQRYRPMDPSRFWAFLHSEKWNQASRLMLRSSGYFWLASRPELAGFWNQVAKVARHGVAGFWDLDTPQQDLSFIGLNLDLIDLENDLEACLLSDAEYDDFKNGSWIGMNIDPFPEWLDDDHDHEE